MGNDMASRTITIERSTLYDICNALSSEARRFDELAGKYDMSLKLSYEQKATDLRALTANLLSLWDAATQSNAA